MDSLKSMAEKIRGSFVFTALDQNQTLYFVKGSNPLCLLYFEHLGLYVYASTESIMKSALKKVGLHKEKNSRIKVEEGEIISIDRNGFLSRNEFDVQDDINFFKSRKWNTRFDEMDWYATGYTAHEQMLIDYCKFYGIDNYDVMLLLDYGYTADEIEDMLMDYDLLHSTIQSIKRNNYYDDFLFEE